MKRKLADRLTWRRILRSRFVVQYVDTEAFVGYVSLLCLDEVSEPLWLELSGQRICVVDNGFTWLQQFPIGAYHAVTTIFDKEGRIVEWYIDICKQHGVTLSLGTQHRKALLRVVKPASTGF